MKNHKKTVIREAFQHSNRKWNVTLDNFEFDGRNFLINADVDREAAVIDHEPDFGDRYGRGDKWGSESTGVSDIEIVEWDENGNETQQIDPMSIENKELVKAAEEAALIQSDKDAEDEETTWGKPKREREYDPDDIDESQLRKLVKLVTEVVTETKSKKRRK